jgi:hypothetical protein
MNFATEEQFSHFGHRRRALGLRLIILRMFTTAAWIGAELFFGAVAARSYPISSSISPNLFSFPEETVRQVMVDIDHDGDVDLISLTSLPRLLVWLNDGKGHLILWHSRFFLIVDTSYVDPESSDEDAPLFWWAPSQPTVQLMRIASAEAHRESFPKCTNAFCPGSPRAPPPSIS